MPDEASSRNDSLSGRRQGQEVELERVDKYGASGILGISPKKVVGMARELPGSARIGGEWTFSVARLRAYVREREVSNEHVGQRELSKPEAPPGTYWRGRVLWGR